MKQAKIIEKEFNFRYSLEERGKTDMIVLHHTGGSDIDTSAEQIHDWHYNHQPDAWSGIGYHFVIRKDGTIERGRPEWAIGSHAYKNNSDTIGIHLSGNFNLANPTDKQIESTAMLIANLTDKYNIPTDRQHIIGHEECYSGVGRTNGTGCPGRNLQSQLDTISGKANWYRYNTDADVVDKCPTCGRKL